MPWLFEEQQSKGLEGDCMAVEGGVLHKLA